MGAAGRIRRRGRQALALCLIGAVPALTGCGSASTGTVAAPRPERAASTKAGEPLRLHLATGSYATTSPSATVRGAATKGASVRVNGRFVRLRNGRWQRTLKPRLGANRVVVIATMTGHARVVRTITITRHRTPAEIEARATAKREAETRATETKEAQARAKQHREAEAHSRETETTSTCTNGTYVNAAGNTVCKPVESPTVPAGATARCGDGTYSFSESRSGTCSHHEGVAEWLSP